jgi:hypothetical protein
MAPKLVPSTDAEFAVFVEKLSQFRAALDDDERCWLDAILLAAGGDPEHDVLGHALATPRQLACAVAQTLGLAAPSPEGHRGRPTPQTNARSRRR